MLNLRKSIKIQPSTMGCLGTSNDFVDFLSGNDLEKPYHTLLFEHSEFNVWYGFC